MAESGRSEKVVDGREWYMGESGRRQSGRWEAMGESGRWEGVVDGREWYMGENGRWQ